MIWLFYYKIYKMYFWCIKVIIFLFVIMFSIYEKNDKIVINMLYSVKVFLYMVIMVLMIYYFKFWCILVVILGIYNS